MSSRAYPPSPPPSRGNRPPPIRINTHVSSAASIRSASHSPSKAGPHLYNLPTPIDSPTQSRARPGGFAGIEGPSRVRSPPGTPGVRAQYGRRGSNESSLRPPSVSRNSEHSRLAGGSNYRDGVHSPSPADLQLFAHHCRLFYFSPSPPQDSANFISTTLAALPPSHRAAYTRLQSSLRSSAHLHHLRVRISSFHALISSTIASASLTPSARQDVTGPRAKAERLSRMAKFVSTWCTAHTGGVEPFFRGLWGVLRAQSRTTGGAGDRRVVWEVDDAVFLESGGSEFMHEAVTMLKGVLGLDDQPLTAAPRLRRIPTSPKADSRSRATSDPFIDPRGRVPPRPPPSRRTTPNNPLQPLHSPQPESPLLNGMETLEDRQLPIPEDRVHLLSRRTMSDASDEPQSAHSMTAREGDGNEPTEDDVAAEEADLNQPRFRLWTFPSHISNQECEQMMSLFPRSIARTDIRFPYIPPNRGSKAMEEARWDAIMIDEGDQEPKVIRVPKLDIEAEEGAVRCGTGRMWAGSETRYSGYRGSAWFRFKRWWRTLLGMG